MATGGASGPPPAQRGLDLEALAEVEDRDGTVVVRIPALGLVAEGSSPERAWARLSERLVASLPHDAELRRRLDEVARHYARPVAPSGHLDLVAHEALSSLPSVDSADFESRLEGPVPTLVEFWATWSEPSLDLAPALHAAAEHLSGRIDVVRVDIDTEPDLVDRYDILSVPTLILFSGGGERLRLVGSRSRSQLLGELAPFLSHPAR